MKQFLLLSALGVGMGLATADTADAQRWDYSRGGITIGAPGGFSINYGYPGYYRGYGYYTYGDWYGRGYYNPYYGGPSAWYQSYPGYYGYQSYVGRPYQIYPDGGVAANLNDQRGYTSFYDGNRSQQAELRVQLPDANARLTIDGQPTMQRGTDRVFAVPNLEAGKNYTYTLRASWMEGGREVTREKKLDFKAGDRLVADFADGQQRPADGQQPPEPRGLRSADDRSSVAPTNPDQRLDPIQGEVLTGKIVRIEGKQLVFMPVDGSAERTFQLPDDAAIVKNGVKASLQDLKPDMQVSLTTRSGSPTIATRIEVRATAPDDGIKP